MLNLSLPCQTFCLFWLFSPCTGGKCVVKYSSMFRCGAFGPGGGVSVNI
ncbi:hypothetical protein HMPREF0262_00806 [Clostridium sp. ATCC 29733]|nr:hypothetical protein HMPREF0262_00806 [Clostridium sp. ATCC 29733]